MFASNRLSYRKLSRTDFGFYCQLFSDQEVMKYTYLEAFSSKEEARYAFEKALVIQEDENQGTQYIAALKGRETAIGIIDYEVLIENNLGGIYEIGYFIQKAYWGKGYATEMGKALIDFLFNNKNIHKVVASCHANNQHSEAIMKKLGMSQEGVFKLARYKKGSWVDEIKYGLLRQDWSEGQYKINCRK
ncbi:GNAT family N-acetyltransferase [Cellulosilyticum sp. I15G10I2]|uniref:GNAT family N-acetyltransferase n=1 Tax=Cellulosilyticum sp. I15G10I2 TaxID=1892843 RepID=UPI00085C9C1E|nr:GNAT family protein [Cellulosilyticum sp. I15G10I2]